MSNNKVKVVGYAKKEVFNGNIEYRNFSPDLVGHQSTGDSTFTFGNFAITTTLENKINKLFSTNKFSNFVSLSDINTTPEETKLLLDNNSNLKLKLDKSDLSNYAYFGSMLEYIRVSLENIITNWPASLYVSPISGIYNNQPTVEDYNYEALTDESTFKVSTNSLKNLYQINYLQNGSILDTFNESNDLRNLTINYESYSILNDSLEYDVIEYTGATTLLNDYLYFRVKGNPFPNITGGTTTKDYHIKPNKVKEEIFFNTLPDFESNLLNRLTTPKYSSTFKTSSVGEGGSIILQNKTVHWPVSDGYNIDFDTTNYTNYVSKLIDIATGFDESMTNLMVRFLTSETISDFDTTPRCDGVNEDSAGQKMNRTLKIWGRSFDEFKRYVNGIQFANTVTYNGLDNTPDMVLKYLARTMGWEMVQSILENDLLKNYVTSTPTSYSGMSRGYTAIEAEVEMWRRLILNSPWLWKSKGARKSIEFLFKFIGAPDGLIEFNEFIYLAQNKIDVDLFKTLLEANGLSTDMSQYPIDSEGYPRVPNNTQNMYFQKGGLWYRQTGGSGATIDIVEGNNPHVGPYDGGAAFINQFNDLIPNFSATTITSTTTTTSSTELFTNYDNGDINLYEGDYYIDIISDNNLSLEDCIVVTAEKVEDPYPKTSQLTDCGCEIEEDDYALLINVGCDHIETDETNTCEDKVNNITTSSDGTYIFHYKQYDEFGNELSESWLSPFNSKTCCQAIGGTPIYTEIYSDENPTEIENIGYICCTNNNCGCSVTCDWSLATLDISQMITVQPYTDKFLLFEKPSGEETVVTPTGCSCVAGHTIPIQITDPTSGEVGIGCKLTENGITDLTNDVKYYIENGEILVVDENTTGYEIFNSWVEAVYSGRKNNLLGCLQYMIEG